MNAKSNQSMHENHHGEGGRFHADDAAGNRHTMRFALGADIDHVRLPALIEMGQATVVVFMQGMIRFRVHG